MFSIAITFLMMLSHAEIVTSASDEDLRKVFKLMIDDSSSALSGNRKQVLSLLILSDEEIQNINLVPEHRRRIYINQRRGTFPSEKNIPAFFTNKDEEIHGEIIALYIENTIKTLLDEFKKDNKRDVPHLLVYSYYIPCASVPNIPYSCAEEVAKASRYYDSQFYMHVGYSDIFVGTDSSASIEFLLNSGIKSVIDLRTNTLPEVNTLRTRMLFQERMFTCMKKQNIVCRADADRDMILAYQVNLLTKQCTENSLFYGAITTFGLNSLGDCLYSADWKPCCGSIPNEQGLRLAVRECLDLIMREHKPSGTNVMEFGEVTSLSDTTWRPIVGMDIRRWDWLFKHLDVPETDPNSEKIISVSSGGVPCVRFGKRINSDQFGKIRKKYDESIDELTRQEKPGGKRIRDMRQQKHGGKMNRQMP